MEGVILNTELMGSNLTRAMLNRGDKPVWCVVADNSDKEAMENLLGNDFTAYIANFDKGSFYCTAGMEWKFAVPIKIIAMTATEMMATEMTATE